MAEKAPGKVWGQPRTDHNLREFGLSYSRHPGLLAREELGPDGGGKTSLKPNQIGPKRLWPEYVVFLVDLEAQSRHFFCTIWAILPCVYSF